MKRLFVLLIIFSKLTYSYINIYPTKFEKDVTKGANETFKLYNRSDKEVRYRIYLEENNKENDMSKWSEIYPSSLKLSPLEEKEIRLFIKPPKNTPKGKYKTKLVIKQVGIPKEKNKSKINFFTIFKLNMIGYVGANDESIRQN